MKIGSRFALPTKNAARKGSSLLGKQTSIVFALFVRDALRKYGHENFGFFWIVVEPLLFTVGIMILWNIIRESHAEVSVTAFALTAYTMITMWRHLSGGFAHILQANAGVLYHPNVHPLHIMAARGLLETFGCLGTFFVAYVPLALLGVIDPMRDPLVSFGAWFLAAWYSFSFGIILGCLSEMSDTLAHALPAFMYLTLPLTGAFTMQEWLPEKARDILSYSPLVNTMEMWRSGMFSENVTTYWSIPYVITWCLAQTVIGLLLVEKARKYVEIV